MKIYIFLKKYLFLTLSLFLFLTVNLTAQYQPGLATLDDIQQLDEMYDWILENDKVAAEKIVIYPKALREQILADKIRQERIFVMRDGGRIASILTMYPLIDKEETRNILKYEIRATDENFERSYTYHLTQTILTKFTESLERLPVRKLERSLSMETPFPTEGTPPSFSFDHVIDLRPKAAKFYYGGAYTFPADRMRHLNTLLRQWAFEFISPSLIECIRKYKCNELTQVFGQVLSNAKTSSSTRIFGLHASFIYKKLHEEDLDDFEVFECEYTAFKPVFDIIDGQLTPCRDNDPRAQKGLGKVLTFSLTN